MPGHVDAHGNFVLDGDGEEGGWVDLEVGERGGDGAGDVVAVAGDGLVEDYVRIVGGVAGELDFEIAVEIGVGQGGLGETKANGDERELSAAGDLEHVEVAVGVAGVEGFYRGGQEELTDAEVADALAAGGVADAIDLMQRVGHVVGEGGLVEGPDAVGRGLSRDCDGSGEKKECEQALHWASAGMALLRCMPGMWMGQETAMIDAP